MNRMTPGCWIGARRFHRCGAVPLSVASRGRLGLLISLAAAALPAMAQSLADLSLEELATIQITSVSRRPESLSDAAASIYVITADAIRRSGATSLPQALRLAPNLQVAQVDASQYAISARGFNNAIGNKLLVLIDGRTVYTPFFSGVFWDQQDVMLEDVDRIEVISGPGSTLWGANAVNGVINVITRPARLTQGTRVAADAGTDVHHLAVRAGGAFGDGAHWRLYAKHRHWRHTESQAGASLADGGQHSQAGFRAGWSSGTDLLVLQGDVYDGRSDRRGSAAQPFPAVEWSGANLLARWTRTSADGSNWRVQGYVDRARRDDAFLYRPEIDIADFEFQNGLSGERHKVLWGGGVRHARDRIRPGLIFGFHPERRSMRWANLFVQDAIALTPDLALTVGLKLEHNGFTGLETLPSARLAWKLADRGLLWAALSRAVRAPARLDRDISLPPQPPFIIAGGPDFDSELAHVAEVGWRSQTSPAWTWSATLFHHRWDRLRSGELPPNAQVRNQIEGSTSGFEAWSAWQPVAAWRLSGGFTVLHKRLRLESGSRDPEGPRSLGNDPRLQATVRATFQPAAQHEVELGVRRIGELPDPVVPAYTAVDLRWGWQVRPAIGVALAAFNLLDAGHVEFGAAGRSVQPRHAQLQVRATW
jgi:iron complex outermembrane recepter protein